MRGHTRSIGSGTKAPGDPSSSGTFDRCALATSRSTMAATPGIDLADARYERARRYAMSNTHPMILFYDKETRAGATAMLDKGAMPREQHEFDPGTFGDWTHIVSDGRFLLFYSKDSLAGATALLDDGAML